MEPCASPPSTWPGTSELGWATTGYGNQGVTVDVGIAVIEPTATRAGIYVAMTRGRRTNVAWVPDPTGRADPADALAEAMACVGQELSCAPADGDS